MNANAGIAGSKRTPSFSEFVIVISLMMSLTALSIDAMLPALPAIGEELRVRSANDRQLVVSSLFLGLSVGQLFFGPLSDSTGRKPAIYAGYALYLAGSLTCMVAFTFPMILAGRLLQGFGISAPRALALAIVRDRYEGRMMARVMSFVMTVFILVPMIAPSLGQVILRFASWRSIFFVFILIAVTTVLWFGIRMPETLSPHHRAPFSLQRLGRTTREVLGTRITVGYTVSAGLIGGAFLGYLSSAQQIYQELYGLGVQFPLYFALVSLSIGLASFVNARIVLRFGMRFLVRVSLSAIIGLSGLALAVTVFAAAQPPFWFLMVYLMLTFFCIGILFGNQNTLAMQPLGHLAGIGAAIVGALATLIQMVLGTTIGRTYDGTIAPLVAGFFVLGGLAMVAVFWAERRAPS
jgi:MFS transporter, DHA1 family, multidrug resistance protein